MPHRDEDFYAEALPWTRSLAPWIIAAAAYAAGRLGVPLILAGAAWAVFVWLVFWWEERADKRRHGRPDGPERGNAT